MTYPFVLGTAQLGNHYGITNLHGCPDDKEVDALLRYSLEKGINWFDSAVAYGISLDRISQFFSTNNNHQAHLINKFSVNENLDQLYVDLLRMVEVFGGKPLHGLLVHDPQNLRGEGKNRVLSFLDRVKKENIAAKIGVSIYDAKDLDNILDVYSIDLLQCPVNLLDQRLLESNLLDELKQRNIEIHGRSLFLQGVLLVNTLPETVKALKHEWEFYHKTLTKIQMDPIHFICSWIKTIKVIDKWVIGVNSRQELEQILQGYDQNNTMMDFDYSIFNSPSNKAIDPRTWMAQ